VASGFLRACRFHVCMGGFGSGLGDDLAHPQSASRSEDMISRTDPPSPWSRRLISAAVGSFVLAAAASTFVAHELGTVQARQPGPAGSQDSPPPAPDWQPPDTDPSVPSASSVFDGRAAAVAEEPSPTF
jgi:hypothetical protein